MDIRIGPCQISFDRTRIYELLDFPPRIISRIGLAFKLKQECENKEESLLFYFSLITGCDIELSQMRSRFDSDD